MAMMVMTTRADRRSRPIKTKVTRKMAAKEIPKDCRVSGHIVRYLEWNQFGVNQEFLAALKNNNLTHTGKMSKVFLKILILLYKLSFFQQFCTLIVLIRIVRILA